MLLGKVPKHLVLVLPFVQIKELVSNIYQLYFAVI